MTPTKSQQAQEYAEKKMERAFALEMGVEVKFENNFFT